MKPTEFLINNHNIVLSVLLALQYWFYKHFVYIRKIEIYEERKYMQDVYENTYTRHFEKTFRHTLIDKENINTHKCDILNIQRCIDVATHKEIKENL